MSNDIAAEKWRFYVPLKLLSLVAISNENHHRENICIIYRQKKYKQKKFFASVFEQCWLAMSGAQTKILVM